MRKLISKLRFERLRKALGSASASSQGSKPAEAEVLEVQEALALVEALMCDVISHCPGDEAPEYQTGEDRDRLTSVNAFGRAVVTSEASSVSECIAAGAGMALAGLRSAVFLPGDHIAEGFAQLETLAARQVPLVVHAAFREGFGPGSNHSGYHGASELGLFQVMPISIQNAVDVTLLARWLAERGLTPGLVGFDRRIVESAVLPSVDLVTDFLTDSDGNFDSPTAAQLLLFGQERPPVPAWFDLDRPISFGGLQGSSDGASAAVGRQAFFQNHLRSLAAEGMKRLSRLTGREQKFVEEEGLSGADLVVVTQGSAFETVKAAAHYLRQEKSLRVGVLGVTWLRPFPAGEIRKALEGRRGIAVLECSGGALADEGPLYREIRRAAGEDRAEWVSASFGLHGQPLAVGQVVELIEKLREGKAPSRVWLGIVSGPDKLGDFPKRQGLLKSVTSDYPNLRENTISAREVEKLSSKKIKTIQWMGPVTEEVSAVMDDLAEACTDVAGPNVRGFGWFPEPGVLSVRVSAGPDGVPIPEAGTALDVLLLGRSGLDLISNPLAEVKEGQHVVIESPRAAQEIWQLMPDFWKDEVRRLKLHLYKAEGGFDELLSAARALVGGNVDLPFPRINWPELGDEEQEKESTPALIRRVQETGATYDNLPRFWGEVMQPKRAGVSDNFPDPLVTVGAVPPYTAALARPRATALPNIPVLDANKCTACGHCWPVCPDSAIGVSLLRVEEYLNSVADQIGSQGKVPGAVKRAHRPLSAKLAAQLTQDDEPLLSEDLLMETFESVLEKLPVGEDEKEEYKEVFARTAERAHRLSPVVSKSFFKNAEGKEKGSGRLLLLAINPDACQGCQLCIESCPETALHPYDRAGTISQDSREAWRVWEELPDTDGATIEAASQELELGPLAGRLLSRFCSQVQAVGSFGEPGSGERLSCRVVTSLVEAKMQKRLLDLADTTKDLGSQLRKEVQRLLSEGLSEAEPDALEAALEDLPRHRASLAEFSEKLSSFGKSVSVDPVKTLRLTQTAQALHEHTDQITEGRHQLGRSRFGVAILSHRIARWAGRYPNHPYHAPLVVEPSPSGAGMVLGLAQALAVRHVDLIRLVRRARLFLEDPPDLPGRLVALEELTWEGLTTEEKQSCPPLLAFVDETGLSRQGLGSVSRLLSSEYPIKIVVLDSKGSGSRLDPALLALNDQAAFVQKGSIGDLRSFARGVDGLVDFTGPALLHLHVPIPREQGFEPSKTLERARRAIAARVHPLLTYDPRGSSSFGKNLSLEGNPDPEQSADPTGLLEWALGETRFQKSLRPLREEDEGVPFEEYVQISPEERRGKVATYQPDEGEEVVRVEASLVQLIEQWVATWSLLQEVGGLKSPFVSRIRSEVEGEVRAEKEEEIQKMKTDYEARIAELEKGAGEEVTSQLRERLLQLAGFGSKDKES